MGMRVDRAEIISGITVYSDDQLDNVFYALPNQPRYSIDPVTSKPIFRFVKYRDPVERPDGKKGGGIAIFQVEFSLTPEQFTAIKLKKQADLNVKYSPNPAPDVQIGMPLWTKGKATISVAGVGDKALVESVDN